MRFILRIPLVLIVAGMCTSSASAQTTQQAELSKFLRFVSDNNGGGRLEASVVTYRNADGACVDLIGAVHVADVEFFQGLNTAFEQYDAVLYEMVKPRDMRPPATRAAATGPSTRAARARSGSWVSAFQIFLKDKLNLTFQLEQINYRKPNFVHADLDVETFQKMQSDRGESMLTLALQQMVKELTDEPNPADVPEFGVMDLAKAMQSPDSARDLKLLLAKQFDKVDRMMSGMEGPRGTVILTERNKAAIKVLKERLEGGDKKLAIFYGAAHLKGMEKTMTQEMGFKQVGEPAWRTAWDITK